MLPLPILREELLDRHVDPHSLGFLAIVIGGSVIHKPDLPTVERCGSDWDAVGIVPSKAHAVYLIQHLRTKLFEMMRLERQDGTDSSWEDILGLCGDRDWEIVRVSGWTKAGSKRTLKIISQECIESMTSGTDLRHLGVLSHKALECIKRNHPSLGSYLFCIPAIVLGSAGFVMPDADFLTAADGYPGEPCVWPGLVVDVILTSHCLFEASPGLYDRVRQLLWTKWLTLAKNMDSGATVQALLPYLYRWRFLCPEFVETLRQQLVSWEKSLTTSCQRATATKHDAPWNFYTLHDLASPSIGFRTILVQSSPWTSGGVNVESTPLNLACRAEDLPDHSWSLQDVQHHPCSSFSRNSQCQRGFLVDCNTGQLPQKVLLKSSKTVADELQALPFVKYYFPTNTTQEVMTVVKDGACIVYKFIAGKSILDLRLDYARHHYHDCKWKPITCPACLKFQRCMIAAECRRARDVSDAYRSSWSIPSKAHAEATIHQFFYRRLLNDQRMNEFYVKPVESRSNVQDPMTMVLEEFQHLPIKVNGILHHSLRAHLTEAEKVLNPDNEYFQRLPIAFGLGDGHGGNVLLQDGSSTTVPALKYIDYEIAGYHCPLLDLAKPIYLDCFYEVLWAEMRPDDTLLAGNRPTVEWSLEEGQLAITYLYTPDFLSKVLAFTKLEYTLRPVLERILRAGADVELMVAAESVLANALFCSAVLTRDFSHRADLFFLNLAIGVELADQMRSTINGFFGWSGWPERTAPADGSHEASPTMGDRPESG